MAEKKQADNENLIQELYEKLWWYTYEADEKDFNAQEVDAIVQLLEVLEPVADDPGLEPGAEAALERFRARYKLDTKTEESEENEETVYAAESGIKKTAGTMDETGEKDESKKRDKTGRKDAAEGKNRRRRRLYRLGGAAAACVALMLSLNMGAYALREKSFFEIIEERIGKTKIIVTGNERETEMMEENDTADIKCSTWEEAEEIVGEKILKINDIPGDYTLDKMSVGLMQEKDKVVAEYYTKEKYITIDIYIYPSNYARNIMMYDEEWQLIKEDTEGVRAQYYLKEGIIEAFFTYGKCVYYISSNDELEVVEKVIDGMK